MRLLVVEDDPKLVRLLERGLREEGHEVTSVGDGESGLKALVAGGFDACVLDVLLPAMDGFTLDTGTIGAVDVRSAARSAADVPPRSQRSRTTASSA